jgi:hypothetical protein
MTHPGVQKRIKEKGFPLLGGFFLPHQTPQVLTILYLPMKDLINITLY